MMMMMMMGDFQVTLRGLRLIRPPDESCFCACSRRCTGGPSGSSGSSDQAEWAVMYGHHAAHNKHREHPLLTRPHWQEAPPENFGRVFHIKDEGVYGRKTRSLDSLLAEPGCLFGFLCSKNQPSLNFYQLPEPFLDFLPQPTLFKWWRNLRWFAEKRLDENTDLAVILIYNIT